MKRASFLPLFTLLLIPLLIITGCGSQSVEEATQEFCQSLVAYDESLATLESLSPTSTVGGVKDAQKAEQRARQDVKDSARDLREVKLDNIDQAWQDLDTTIDRVSNQDTLAEVADQVRQDLANVRVAYDQLGLGNCPDLFPSVENLPMPAPDQPAAPSQSITETQPITGAQPITGTASITGTEPITSTQPVTATEAATAPVTTTVASTTTATIPSSAAQPEAAPAVAPGATGVTWYLQAIELTNGSPLTPSDPALYTLTLQPDGTASVVADCFSGEGTFTVAGDKISFALSYTGAMCPPPSIASQYTNYLSYASSYALIDDALVITYSNGAGKLTFTPAPQ